MKQSRGDGRRRVRGPAARHIVRVSAVAAIIAGGGFLTAGVAIAASAHAAAHARTNATGGSGSGSSGVSGASGVSGVSGVSGASGVSGSSGSSGVSGNSGVTTSTVEVPSSGSGGGGSGGGVPTGAGTDRGPFKPGQGQGPDGWWMLASGSGLVLLGSAGALGLRRRRPVLD